MLKEEKLDNLLTIMETKVSGDETVCLSLKLPPEILHKIFDYLDSTSVKNAACTCHYWAHAFAIYCSKRYMLHICEELSKPYSKWLSPVSNCCSDTSCPHKPLKLKSRSSTVSLEVIAHTLKHSTRQYNAMRLDIFYDKMNAQHMESLLETVFRKDWLARLQILELGLGIRNTGLIKYTLGLSAVLPLMTQLKQLTLLHSTTFSNVNFFPHLQIENDSLEVLILSSVVPRVINCPKMHRLAVSSHLDVESMFGRQYARYAMEEPCWKLRQLTELTVSSELSHVVSLSPKVLEHRPGYNLQFYQQLTKLQRLTILNMFVPERLFQGLCKSCVLLERLIIKYLHLIDPDALRSLSNLSRLQRLVIYKVKSPRPISFVNVQAPLLRKIRIGPNVACSDTAANLKRISYRSFCRFENTFRLILQNRCRHRISAYAEYVELEAERRRRHTDRADQQYALSEVPQINAEQRYPFWARCAETIDIDNVVALYIHAKNMIALLTYDVSVKRLLFAKKSPTLP